MTKLKTIHWKIAFVLSAIIIMLVAGCSGGSLNLSNGAVGDPYGANYTISGDTPVVNGTPIPRPNTGAINVRVPRLDLEKNNAVTGTIVSSTLGTFNISGTNVNGQINATATGPNGVTASFVGQLVTNPNGSRTITGTLTFSNGQSTQITLNEGNVPNPTATPGPSPTPTIKPTPGPTNNIVGTFLLKKRSAPGAGASVECPGLVELPEFDYFCSGNQRLTFKANGQYISTTDGVEDGNGTYKISGSQLRLIDAEDGATDVANFSFSGNTLTITITSTSDNSIPTKYLPLVDSYTRVQ